MLAKEGAFMTVGQVSADSRFRQVRHVSAGPTRNESVALVPIGELRASTVVRLRGMDVRHVEVLAAIEDELPPIMVRRETMEVVDGLHRLRAAELRGSSMIRVTFFDGDPDDAFVLAVRLNVKHGLPLTQADRVAAATRIIAARPDWSDRRIARISGLAPNTVGSVRMRTSSDGTTAVARVGMDGKLRPVDPVEGRVRAAELIEQRPEASLREIAAAAGIGLGTAHDVRNRVRDGNDPIPPKLRGNRGRTDKPPKDTPEARPPRANPEDVGRIFDLLCRDPSLRFTEDGRVVLRLLRAHFIDDTEWHRIIDAVPPHCGEAIIQVAIHCSEVWASFANKVQSRVPPEQG
jgi:ParB-like nuclease family protein